MTGVFAFRIIDLQTATYTNLDRSNKVRKQFSDRKPIQVGFCLWNTKKKVVVQNKLYIFRSNSIHQMNQG